MVPTLLSIRSLLLATGIFFLFFPGSARAFQADAGSDSTHQIEVIFSEDFDSIGTSDWFAENGIWEIGSPTSGPDTSRSGTSVVATILNGDYPPAANSRLVSPLISLTSTEDLDGARLRLKFDHWYSMSSGDFGYLEIKTDGSEWQPLTENNEISGISAGWEPYFIADLSAFEGQQVYLGFRFESTDASTSAGWYIDDLQIYEESSTTQGINQEDFEAPVLDWAIENGVWEFGSPTTGPLNAHGGDGVAGTILNGIHPDTLARLVSPPIQVPTLTLRQNFSLKFWHWFSLAEGDEGKLQISVNNGEWEDLPGVFKGESTVWTKYVIPDLRSYADPDSSIKISFVLETSNNGTNGAGWYIDDFETIITEAPAPLFVTSDMPFPLINLGPEDLDSPGYEWFSDNGVWETGFPTAGPGNAHSDSLAAGTVLNGNYPNGANSRFVSPIIDSNADEISLRFWHWFDFSPEDQGIVQIQILGQEWRDISTPFTGTSGTWTQYRIPVINGYRNELIRFGFLFTSQGSGSTSSGWYLDDISMNAVSVAKEEFDFFSDSPILKQNFPNPFNPITNISFHLPTPDKVSLTVVDLLGREIATLVNQVLPAGDHEIMWDASGASNGIYFYRFHTPHFTQTKKMMLVR